MPEDATNPSRSPIDTALCDRIAVFCSRSERFETVDTRPPVAPNSVVAAYDLGYFPNGVKRASLQIRWFETDDSSIHYTEQYRSGNAWECRWDRHPNDHNSREHFHPPPDAATPAEDRTLSDQWRDVLATVLTQLDTRIESFWQE